MQRECPHCGELVDEGLEYCPSCGSELERHVDEVVDEQVGAPDEAYEPTRPEPSVGPPSKGRPLSIVGIAFAVLTVVCIIGLLLVVNYDTWIAGEDESNIGDTQMMYVYLAVAAVVVCIVLVAWDWMRTRRAATA